jgi:enoyl-CoA hydratase
MGKNEKLHRNVNIEKIYSNKIWIIKINREKFANSIDKRTADELFECFDSFEKDPISCVAILTGTGKYFSAGADLKEVDKNLSSILDNLSNQTNYPNKKTNMNELSQNGNGPLGITRLILSKPTIAAINGSAVARGFELILWCDMRVTYPDCEFGIYCRRFGVPLIDGGTYRLPMLVGLSRSMDLILTGRKIKGEEAFHIGLINRLTAQKKVLEESISLAKELCELPQTCLRNDRLSLITNCYRNYKDLVSNEFHYGLESLLSTEAVIGSSLFSKGEGRHGDSLKPKF